MKIAKSLPAAMYHYVNNAPGGITLVPSQFEDHCRILAEAGWHGVGLEEALAFYVHGEKLPEKSFLFTFDDGFLDNFQIALPILKRYGHKGVVFAVSSRLEAGNAARIALSDILEGKAALPEVSMPLHQTAQGYTVRKDVFLNHAETIAMHGEGTLAVASHSRGHFGVFTGPEYTDFVRPGTNLRTFYRTEEEPVWGLPDFTVKPGLLHRGFIPEPRMVEEVKAMVPQDFDAADEFFANERNVDGLKALVAKYGLGRFESDAERTERMRREIVGGKQELEAILDTAVHTLCWPWGHYSEEAHRIAQDAGFTLFFTTKEGVNPPEQPLAVHRFKGKPKQGNWLLSRAKIYASPLVGGLYTRLRI